MDGESVSVEEMTLLDWTCAPDCLTIRGVVQVGDRRGRELGFPTANLALDSDEIPDGVWAGWIGGSLLAPHVCAVSIGRRSTFYGRDGVRLLEAHVLDFNDDLYGELVIVHLEQKVRGQRRFANADELVEQLNRDVEAARSWSRLVVR